MRVFGAEKNISRSTAIERVRDGLDDLSNGIGSPCHAGGQPPIRNGKHESRLRVVRAVVAGTVVVAGMSTLLVYASQPASQKERTSVESIGDQTGEASELRLLLSGAAETTNQTVSAGTAPAALWQYVGDGTYVALTVRTDGALGQAPGQLGELEEDTDIASSLGQGWSGAIDRCSSCGRESGTRLWLERPNGDVWIVSVYWSSESPPMNLDSKRSQMREWAEAMAEARDPIAAVLTRDDVALVPITHESGGSIQARNQAWTYRGHVIVASVTRSSGASVLSGVLELGYPAEDRIQGRQAWRVTDREGGVVVGILLDPVASDVVRVAIPAELVSQTNEILDSIEF